MSKVIDKLTSAQEAKIPEYLERFRAIGLSTEATNKEKAEAALTKAYEYLHKSNSDVGVIPNPRFMWAGSPMRGAVLAAQALKGDLNVTDKEIQSQASAASYGSFEAYWVSTYSYIANELPVESDGLVQIVEEIVKECGVYWTFKDLVIVTPKPSEIHMHDEKLHNHKGPAILYPNGDAIYAIDGVIKNSLMEAVLTYGMSNDTPGE